MNITELKQRFVSIRPLKRGGQKNVLKAESADGSVYALKLIPSANDPSIPSNSNYKENQSFKHFLHCVKQQCSLLTLPSYQETYNAYEFMLHSAESIMAVMKRKGIGGQNRDFMPAIEANRIAACATNEDYGFKLAMEWGNM